jgi:acetoacetyl-CoA synthetase
MAPFWTPTEETIRNSHLYRFRDQLRRRYDIPYGTFSDLHAWSVQQLEAFWEAAWADAGVHSESRHTTVLRDHAMPPPHRLEREVWFSGARFNFARQLLRHRGSGTAIIQENETGERRTITFDELYALTARLQASLRRVGVGRGDRVAGFLPNIVETVIAMLATTSLGAIWSPTSPDFGIEGALDRFSQIGPKILFSADGYLYNGKHHDTLERSRRIVESIPSIEHWIVVRYHGLGEAWPGGTTEWNSFLADETSPMDFPALPFDHPAFILYTSGTTGVPKCIVHGAGGTLLKHHVEHKLHTNLGDTDTLFYFTTCGWMMWNWLVSGLAQGCTLVLYDGSPAYPQTDRLFQLAEETGIDVFGTSPKYLAACEKAGVRVIDRYALRSLRTILSTGSPLEASQFHYVERAIKRGVQVSSISGGTDILGCFMLGNPLEPVYAGEIQGPALGMDVAVFDDTGRPVVCQQGELVCRKPFPSMPLGFWNDPEDSKYKEAYFTTYPGVWRHGDYVEKTAQDGIIVYGRSDATLNPGGIRIGTAEIYRIVENLPFVQDSIVASYRRDSEARIALFVVLEENTILDGQVLEKIRSAIRKHATPHHVPGLIRQITEVPVTLNGKKVEVAVSALLNGRPIKNRDALANPEALRQFEAVDLED